MTDEIIKILALEQEKLRGIEQLVKCIDKITDEEQVKEIAEVISEIIKSKEFHSGLAHKIMGWQVKSGIIR